MVGGGSAGFLAALALQRTLPMPDALDLVSSNAFRWDPLLEGGLPLHPSSLR